MTKVNEITQADSIQSDEEKNDTSGQEESVEELLVFLEKEQSELEKAQAILEKEQAKIQDEQVAIEKEKVALGQEKTIITTDLQTIKKEKKELNDEKKKLEKLRSTLADKERNMAERELNAENNFTIQNEKSLQVFNQKRDALENKIAQQEKLIEKKMSDKEKKLEKLIQTYEIAKVEKQREVDLFLENYKEEKMKQIESEYTSNKNELIQQLERYKQVAQESVQMREQELQEREQLLKKRANELALYKQELEKKEEQLNETRVEYEGKLAQLNLEKRFLKQDEEILKQTIEARVEEKVKEQQQLLADKVEAEAFLIRKLSHLEKRLADYERVDLQSGQRSKEELLAQIDKQQDEIRSLLNDLKDRPTKDIYVELEEKSRKYQELIDQKEELARKVVELEQKEHTYLLSVNQLQSEREQREIEEKRRLAVTAQIEKYQEEVNRLRSLYEQPKEIQARIDVIQKPQLKKKPSLTEEITEISWLDRIYNKSIESGLHFNRRLMNSFHTALKTAEWSPLTVLAGVSGTGKSELPRLYSRFGGMYYLPLPVQPDWDSPQSLFGYFNSVDNRFNATPLLKALNQFQSIKEGQSLEDNLSDSMFLVLLDEMNLAHVELYFSELLSKLETRRGEKNAVNIDIDLGAGMDKYPIELTRNVLWVGTMNEDETTKSLSDKVLDRGNLISFPRPKRFERRLTLELAPESPMLKKETWNRWINQKVVLDKEIEKYKNGLEEINSHLEVVGRALGHRVWQSVENYISNHPYVIRAKESQNDAELSSNIRQAFEEALVHKVMPKLRGIETSGRTNKVECLEPIERIIADIAGGLHEDYQLAMKSTHGLFVWRSAKYLEESE